VNWRHPITWVAIALNLVLLFGGWKLLHQEFKRCRTLDREIRSLQQQALTRRGIAESEAAALRTREAQLSSRLDNWRKQLAPLEQDPVLTSGLENDEARIDFKVALFETRQRLRAKAEKNELWIPDDIGLRDTIAEGEDTETRLWQLAAVAHLIDGALSVELPSIDYLNPIPWDETVPGDELQYEEYPVELSVLCSYREWLTLLEHFSTKRPYLALRRFSVEVDRPYPGTMLSVQAVYAGSRLTEPMPSTNEDLTPKVDNRIGGEGNSTSQTPLPFMQPVAGGTP